MTYRTDIAPLDLAPSGKALPFVADEAREHPDTEQLLTVAQSTPVLDEGLGGWMTAPVETELLDIGADPAPETLATPPWLAAQVVLHSYRPQAYGRTTKVWLHYGIATGELTPAEAREALEAMRDFADRFEALVAVAEEIAVNDFEGDPEMARQDRAAEDARIKAINEGRA